MLLLGLLLAAAARDFAPFLRPAVQLWLRGNLLQPVGFVLFALRGRIDEVWSVLLANVLIVLAMADYARALHLLMQRPDPWRQALAGVLVVALAASVFTFVVDRIAVRVVVTSLAMAWFCVSAARAVLDRRWRRLAAANRITAGVFVFAAVVLGVRILHTLGNPQGLRDGLQPSDLQTLVFGAGALLPLLCSYGFLLLCNARMQQELVRNAALDFLTGALNRGAIEDQGARALNRARRRGTPCAAIVIDVDHFKRINDAHGHAAGDAALREIVERLRAAIRLEDGLGRLGGEEFLVLLDDTDPMRALATAERLRDGIRALPLALESGPHPCTISLGVAVLVEGDRSFSDLLRRADRALYAAKDAGRDRVVMAD